MTDRELARYNNGKFIGYHVEDATGDAFIGESGKSPDHPAFTLELAMAIVAQINDYVQPAEGNEGRFLVKPNRNQDTVYYVRNASIVFDACLEGGVPIPLFSWVDGVISLLGDQSHTPLI